MESTQNSQNIQLISDLLGLTVNPTNPTNPTNLTFDLVSTIVNSQIESSTGCKLYNKDKLLEEIRTKLENEPEKIIEHTTSTILKNLVPEIKFETLFKSNLEFTLVFNQDDIIILYKNKQVEIGKLEEIKKDLLETKVNYIPVISELYVNNLIKVIDKLIKKDISVKYNLVNFPQPYWNLFEIKCKKSNKDYTSVLSEYTNIEKIISGRIYESDVDNNKLDVKIMDQDSDEELKIILMQIEEFENHEKIMKMAQLNVPNLSNNSKQLTEKEMKDLDNHYRMEIMSYLNDMEMIFMLDKMEHIDNFDKDSGSNLDVNKYVNELQLTIQSSQNKMIKYYFAEKLLNYICSNDNIIKSNDNMRIVITNQINELSEELYIVQTAGLQFSIQLVETFNKSKALIDTIEKQKNPAYVSKWSVDSNIKNQQTILNQIWENKTNLQNVPESDDPEDELNSVSENDTEDDS